MNKYEKDIRGLLHASGVVLVRDGLHKVFRLEDGQNFVVSKTPSAQGASRESLATLRRLLDPRRFEIATTTAAAPIVQILPTAFGGFALQAQKYGDSYYSTAAGKVALRDPHYSYPDSDWPSEPWYDFTIKLQSDRKTAGVAVVDHPLNPLTRWHNARYLWMLNPCISTFGPFLIHPNQPLILRYRLVVHDGQPPTELIQKPSDEWRATDSNPFPNQAAQSTGN